ncbi:inositol phosphate phosphatase SopB [Parendozoicomonas haliclonae]|uniref:Inositol phosphate phosphatase SopB n=1 Tax=Parendozoicomonas haliclonae TaxID=1960125 RepID=A0A1X7AJQ4_9GAMM|nr:inositol phosphate phosphatase SopB [Parendozoicomonas haliclonae]SMA47053.1 Inositol phosphate phosphatase SopB [Parendozoicomonas haliclonae]
MQPNHDSTGRAQASQSSSWFDYARGAASWASSAIYGVWQVSATLVSWPFTKLGADAYIESRLEDLDPSRRTAPAKAPVVEREISTAPVTESVLPVAPETVSVTASVDVNEQPQSETSEEMIVDELLLESINSQVPGNRLQKQNSVESNASDSDLYIHSDSGNDTDSEAELSDEEHNLVMSGLMAQSLPHTLRHSESNSSTDSEGFDLDASRTRAQTLNTRDLRNLMTKSLRDMNQQQVRAEVKKYNKGLKEEAKLDSGDDSGVEDLDLGDEGEESMLQSLMPTLQNIQSLPQSSSPEDSLRSVLSAAETTNKLVRSDVARELDTTRNNSFISGQLKRKEFKAIPKSEHAELAATFARTLGEVERFNKKVMLEAFNQFMKTYVSRTHRLMPKVVNLARAQRVMLSQPVVQGDFKTMKKHRSMSDDKALLERFSGLVDEVGKAVYAPIYGGKASTWQEQINQLDKVLNKVNSFDKITSKNAGLVAAIQDDLQVMAGQLLDRQEQLKTLRKSDDRKMSVTMKQINAWEADTLAVLEALQSEYEAKAAAKAEKLDGAQKTIHDYQVRKEQKKFKKAFNDVAKLSTKLHSELASRQVAADKEGEIEVQDMVKLVNSHASALSKIVQPFKGGKKRLGETVVARLESQSELAHCSYKVPVRVDGKLHTYTVTYTPAKDFDMTTSEGVVINDPLNLDGRFPCSANRMSKDGQTLVVVEVFDSKEQLVRREVREGTMVPYQEKDEKVRHAMTDKRLLQGVSLVAAANLERYPELDEALSNSEEQEPVDMKMNYVCYLSPDQLRKQGVHENEYMMVQETQEAMDRMSAAPQTLTFGSGTNARSAKVNLQPKMFVFPVNMLGFNGALSTAFRTFELADQINDQAMAKLIGKSREDNGLPGGEVGEYLASEAGQKLAPEARDELIALCRELRSHISYRQYHHAGDRPFYGPWLVDEIVNRIGQGLIDGCKSAKDRTNNANKAIIADACAAHARRKQSPEAPVWSNLTLGKDITSPEMMDNHTNSHIACGALKQQMVSCGLTGYKVDDTAIGMVHPTMYNTLKAS